MIANQLLHQLSLEDPFHQYAASSAKVAAPEPPLTTSTSACPVKATTLELGATKTRADLSGNDSPRSSRSHNNSECDSVNRQLHSYCRPQGSLTNLTFEESQHLRKLPLMTSYKLLLRNCTCASCLNHNLV